MTDAYLHCPNTSLFPQVYGLAGANAAIGWDYYGISNVYTNSIDVSADFEYVVASGNMSWKGKDFLPISDYDYVDCGGDCSEYDDSSTVDEWRRGFMHLYRYLKAEERKYYLFGRADYHVSVDSVALLQVPSTDSDVIGVTALWPLTEVSDSPDKSVKHVGAALIVIALYDGKISETFLRQFAIVETAMNEGQSADTEIMWRKQIMLYSTLTPVMQVDYNNFTAGQLVLVNSTYGAAISPLGLFAVSSLRNKGGQNHRFHFINDLETASPKRWELNSSDLEINSEGSKQCNLDGTCDTNV